MNGTHKAVLSALNKNSYYCAYCFHKSKTDDFADKPCPRLKFRTLAEKYMYSFSSNAGNSMYRPIDRAILCSNIDNIISANSAAIDIDAFGDNEEKFIEYFYGEFLDKWSEIVERGPLFDECTDIDCAPLIMTAIETCRQTPLSERNLRKYLPKTLLREEEEAAARAAAAMREYGNAVSASDLD